MVDELTKKQLGSIPLLKTKAGPRDGELWVQRLKEEYQALIQYVKTNKDSDSDWFRLESNKEGTRWFGKCWYIHELLKYEFDVEFDIPVLYPVTAPEIAIPELDGKTAKMYREGLLQITDVPQQNMTLNCPAKWRAMLQYIVTRGGKICMTDHFKPLWARNVPKFGIGHAMALGLGPWLAVEIPDLVSKGIIHHKEAEGAANH